MNRELPELVNLLELVSLSSDHPIGAYLQTVHPNATKSTLRALLWSIFFQRTLENCEPDTFDVFDTHIVSLHFPHELMIRYTAQVRRSSER